MPLPRGRPHLDIATDPGFIPRTVQRRLAPPWQAPAGSRDCIRELGASRWGRLTPEDLMEFLADHGGHPTSICRHPHDGPDHPSVSARGQTIASLIAVPTAGRLEIARDPGRLEMHRLIDASYIRMEPNERGHYPIAPLGIELGVWRGSYQNREGLWLRWFDEQGHLLPIGMELADHERRRAEQERRDKGLALERAEQECRDKEAAQGRAAELAERLRTLGVAPDKT